MNERMYCYYCSTAFLNSASRILYVIDDRSEWYPERGYYAIEKLADIMLAAKGAGKSFHLEINQNRSENMLLATMLLNGTSVCTVHVMDAEDASRRGGMHRQVFR